MNILLVDDNKDIIRFVTQILELEGHSVDVARDGLEALQRAASQRPHAVVLDVNMPRMEGFDACRRLKELYDVPVMMLTVHAEKSDLQKGADAGADLRPLVRPCLGHRLVEAAQRRAARLEQRAGLVGLDQRVGEAVRARRGAAAEGDGRERARQQKRLQRLPVHHSSPGAARAAGP